MANKQTKKERRDSARRARAEAQRRAARKKTMRRIYGGGITVAVVVAIVVAVILNNQRAAELVADLNEAAPAAGCTELQRVGIQGQTHVEPPETVDYSTNPPTSGNHYSLGGAQVAQFPNIGPAPTDTGIYTGAIPNEVQVHNLEHGHITVQYRPTDDALTDELLSALEAAVRDGDNAQWTLMAPKPDLEHPLAFAGWGKLSTCETPGSPEDVAAFARLFISTQRDGAPESFPGSGGGGSGPAGAPIGG